MPYWTPEHEMALMDMVEQGKSLEEIAEYFHRSPEAIRLKLKRMGLAILESKKEVSSTSTPQQATLGPLKPTEDVISYEEAMKMYLGVLKRLNEPGLTGVELKRLRLILSALRGYIATGVDYLERTVEVERQLDEMRDSMIDYFEIELNRAASEEEKAKWQRKIDELKAEKKADEEWLQKPYTIWSRRADLRRIGFLQPKRRSQP